MKGEIKKIDHIKKSRNPNEAFVRVYFKLENEGWAKTDLVPTFRNYAKWKPLLKIGNYLSGLKMKDSETVDADSFPSLTLNEQKMRNIYYKDKDKKRLIGHISGMTFCKTIDPEKHLQRSAGHTPAIQKAAYDYQIEPHIKDIKIVAGDETFKTDVKNYKKHRRVWDYGHGEQYFMSRKYWTIENKRVVKLL